MTIITMSTIIAIIAIISILIIAIITIMIAIITNIMFFVTTIEAAVITLILIFTILTIEDLRGPEGSLGLGWLIGKRRPEQICSQSRGAVLARSARTVSLEP